MRWLLRGYQEGLYDDVWRFLRGEIPSRLFFEDIHRRFGKSHVLMLVADEVGLGKAPEVWPDLARVIRFSAPTMLDLEEIYHPIQDEILETCPDALRPTWQTTRGRGHYFFPSTGSRLFLFGVDGKHYKKGRGKKSHLSVVDEAAACEPNCEDGVSGYVRSILLPQTFGVNGRIAIATTPPETPGHPSSSLKAWCQAIPGAYAKRTLDDNAEAFGPDVVREYEREQGGRDSTAFRREYLCEWIVDEARAAVPEFAAHREKIVVEPVEPAWYFPLEAMDVGFRPDPTHCLFGFWDFERAKLVVLAEFFERNALTDTIAAGVRATEAATWPWLELEMKRTPGGTFEHEPWRKERREIFRHSDTELRLIADLNKQGLHFAPTAKDEKEAQVAELRLFVRSERLEIHPRCVQLIRSLDTTVWNKQRTEWERGADGHGDGVDALLYMLRNAPRARNPVPEQERLWGHERMCYPPQASKPASGNAALVGHIYGR